MDSERAFAPSLPFAPGALARPAIEIDQDRLRNAANAAEGDDPADALAIGGRGARLKLWQLDGGFHCSIVGTCLSLDDLYRVARKTRLRIAPDATAYDVHGYFVQQARLRGDVAKVLGKLLDRKFARELSRFAKAASAEAACALWDEAMQAGEIAGAYWAVMTHPLAPPALRLHAHGEVHMLSHLMGATHRGEIRRIHELEQSCRALEDGLARARRHAEATGRAKDERIRALEAALLASTTGSAARHGSARTLAPAPSSAALLRRLAALERRVKVERARARQAEQKLEQRAARDAERRQPRRIAAEAAPHPPEECAAACEAEAPAVLDGQRMLYVGGRSNLVAHLRDLVERANGRFLHHDGGIEDSNGALRGLVSQADMVFCPIDCISHDACLRLKHLCKRAAKPFVPLRSAGLSSFAAALQRVPAA